MPWAYIPVKAMLVALVFAIGLFAVACGDGGKNDELKLVPEGATLIGEIEAADILEKVDLDSLLDALPAEEDVPQTIDEALDLIVSETGIDLRDISRAIIFGDLEREDDYFGLIVRGDFDEEGLVAAIERSTDSPLLTEIYKGRDLHIPQDDPDSFVFTLLDQDILVLGTTDAVRDVIDVQEGDRRSVEGDVNAAFNDLPQGLIRLALAVPPEALEDAGWLGQSFLGQPNLFGGPFISSEVSEKLEVFGFALDQDGDALKFQIRLEFADQESASEVANLLDGILKVAVALAPEGQDLGFLDGVQVDRSGSRLTMSLDLQLSVLEDLLEGVFSVAAEESFRDQTPSPAQFAEGQAVQTAIDSLMADKSLVQVTAPATAVNEFSGLDLDPGDGEAFLTSYLRETTTTYYYCWIENGRVISQTELPSGCPQRAVGSIIVSPTHTPGFGTFRSLPGEEVPIMPSRNHVPEGQSVAYSTTPPTSGDHWARWAHCGFYPDGLPDELIVHNLEHGNIVVSYNLSDEQGIAALRAAVNSIALAEGSGVIRFYDKIPEGTVAVAAWGRRARMPGSELGGLASFFAAFAGEVGPERIAC